MIKSKYIIALRNIVVIIIAFAIGLVITHTDVKQNTCLESAQDISSQLTTIEDKITLLNNAVARIGVQDVERLTRENENKDIQIKALKDYIKGFDGFWKGDE